MQFQKVHLLVQNPLNFSDVTIFGKNSTFAESNSIRGVLGIALVLF